MSLFCLIIILTAVWTIQALFDNFGYASVFQIAVIFFFGIQSIPLTHWNNDHQHQAIQDRHLAVILSDLLKFWKSSDGGEFFSII